MIVPEVVNLRGSGAIVQELRRSAEVTIMAAALGALRAAVDAAVAPVVVEAEAQVADVVVNETQEVVEEEWDPCALIGAIRRGDVDSVQDLLVQAPSVNFQVEGMTMLYIAVFKQRTNVVEYLVSQGASATVRNESDYDTPLILARRRGDSELVRILTTSHHRTLLGAGVGFEKFLESPVESRQATSQDANGEKMVECSICYGDECDSDALTKVVTLERCGHSCCAGCLSEFLVARFSDTNAVTVAPIIRCFAKGCSEAVSYRDFETFAPKEISSRYQLRLTTAACRLLPNFSWCVKCESGGLVPESITNGSQSASSSSASNASSNAASNVASAQCNDVTCDACKYEYCFECREDAHPNFSCFQMYEQKMAGDHYLTERATSRAIQKLTKPCPQCLAPTMRDGGCSHMTCRGCSFAWCWLCGKAYTGKYTFGTKCPCGS